MRDWAELAQKYGKPKKDGLPITDKFQNGYGPLYEDITEHASNSSRLLEIGVFKGGSLQLWREVFPTGTIVGVDNYAELSPEKMEIPERCHFVCASQTDDDLPDKVRAYADRYDFIIDDASHQGNFSQITFNLLWPLVAVGGWYVLEDFGVGVPGNEPFYGFYGGTSQLNLAQTFLERVSLYAWRSDGQRSDIEEFRGRASIIAIRKA